MPLRVVIVDVFCVLLAGVGFVTAFRQGPVRRLLGWKRAEDGSLPGGSADPLTYILRIAGMMAMAFGLAFGMITTVFYLA